MGVLVAEVSMYLNLMGRELSRTLADSHHAVHNIERNIYWKMILGWLKLAALIFGTNMVEMRNAERFYIVHTVQFR
jgi:hypothetical protein